RDKLVTGVQTCALPICRRIQPYGWKIDEDFGLFFRGAVLEGSHRWNVDVKEFVHVTRPDGSLYEHATQILDALAQDRFGIAISRSEERRVGKGCSARGE